MRKIVLTLAVLAAATSPANATDYANGRVDQYLNAMIGAGQNQENYCPTPRSNTTAKCIEDFSKMYDKAAEALGFDLMLKKASETKKDERTIRYFQAAANRSFEEMQTLTRKVRELYYPL